MSVDKNVLNNIIDVEDIIIIVKNTISIILILNSVFIKYKI